ncbi:unnamed protein product, partial [Prorocentrum cordatum]
PRRSRRSRAPGEAEAADEATLPAAPDGRGGEGGRSERKEGEEGAGGSRRGSAMAPRPPETEARPALCSKLCVEGARQPQETAPEPPSDVIASTEGRMPDAGCSAAGAARAQGPWRADGARRTGRKGAEFARRKGRGKEYISGSGKRGRAAGTTEEEHRGELDRPRRVRRGPRHNSQAGERRCWESGSCDAGLAQNTAYRKHRNEPSLSLRSGWPRTTPTLNTEACTAVGVSKGHARSERPSPTHRNGRGQVRGVEGGVPGDTRRSAHVHDLNRSTGRR